MKIIQSLVVLLPFPAALAVSPWKEGHQRRQSPVINSTCAIFGLSTNRAIVIQREFEANNIIPDVVPGLFPTTELRVAYGDKKMLIGNTYKPSETLQAPTYDFDPEQDVDFASTRYTLIMVDPDAPGPGLPLLRQFLHLMVSDLAPSCVLGAIPKTVVPYLPLTPLSLAKHRYTLLLYRQPPGVFTPSVPAATQALRAPFDLTEFTANNNLTIVAGNYAKEGLASIIEPLIPPQLKGLLPLPGFTLTGVGYNGPLDGTAEPGHGIGDLLQQVPGLDGSD